MLVPTEQWAQLPNRAASNESTVVAYAPVAYFVTLLSSPAAPRHGTSDLQPSARSTPSCGAGHRTSAMQDIQRCHC
jgi:hypothetical protein